MSEIEHGDIDNGMPPRVLFVFNGLLGHIPENRQRRVALLRMASRWNAIAESYEIDHMARTHLHDLVWRRGWRTDCVVFDHLKVARALETKFSRLNLAFANVYACDGPDELTARLAYMPEVLYVIHGNPEWTYTFGSKGRRGLVGL